MRFCRNFIKEHIKKRKILRLRRISPPSLIDRSIVRVHSMSARLLIAASDCPPPISPLPYWLPFGFAL